MSAVPAFVDFDYWSLYVDVRMGGRPERDGGVFQNSDIYSNLENKTPGQSPPQELPLV